jgi:hypothetical protein
VAPSPDPAPTASVTFSQADVDRIVVDRVKRATQEASDKAKADADKAKLDETERLKLEKKEAEDAKTAAEARIEKTIVNADAKVALLAAGIKPENVNRILSMLDLSGVTVTDEIPDSKAIASAVNQIKGEFPELFGAQQGAGRSGGDFKGGGGNKRIWSRAEIGALQGTKDYETHRDDILAAAREGRITG